MFHNLLLTASNSFLQTAPNIFGSPIRPNGGPVFANPAEGISRIIIFGIQMSLTIGMITVLVYLLWGAFDWITGGGDQEKLDKARQKITNAILGILIMVAALAVFFVVTGDVLGLMKRDADGNWRFILPKIGTCIEINQTCNTQTNDNCCAPNLCVASALPSGDGTCQAP